MMLIIYLRSCYTLDCGFTSAELLREARVNINKGLVSARLGRVTGRISTRLEQLAGNLV